MIGLVIVTHANLAGELLSAAEMIIGPLGSARAVCIHREDSMEMIRQTLAGAIQEVGGEGAVIMTDMFGGTPSNISFGFLEAHRVEVLTGVNLPMVLKFFNSRENLSLAELVRMLKAYGQQGISVASAYLHR
jgi:PTS system mannose-specific IIA component